MAGTVIRVMPKRTLDFTSVSSGSGQAQEIVIAQGIDISNWREVSTMVRTHSTAFPSAIGSIQINAYLEGRTSEDPGILFAATATAGQVTIDFSTVVPAYSVVSLGTNTGAMLKIAAKGTRTGSNAANTIRADVSVDLSLKSA
jgi:hypothetical protein